MQAVLNRTHVYTVYTTYIHVDKNHDNCWLYIILEISESFPGLEIDATTKECSFPKH